MKYCAIIQARMTSSRLPGKVLKNIVGIPVLLHIVNRIKLSNIIDDVIIATTINKQDDEIVDLCIKENIKFFRGSEEDVLLRVLKTAQNFKVENIVEITGDCPLVDFNIIDDLIDIHKNDKIDYVSNVLTRTYPRGLDVQIFSTEVLAKVDSLTLDKIDREHVSIYIYTHPELFSLFGLEAEKKYARPLYRWTLDTQDDFNFITKIYEFLYPKKKDFNFKDIYDILEENPELLKINSHIKQKKIKYYTGQII